ncbi:MAG: hypothetical protein FWC16_09480 [Defluviitaleaceae bacterium]|nr:hypothetical protein [Defluviitaleaceae bacterium]MCL2275143.1 hypothetical protein [Defluviitaleaceae bacterium]
MSTIRTNLLAINAHRGLKNTGIQQRRASQRLSSGFRVNSAADDAAGLAISEKMRGQIRGLDQGERNIKDGISLIQTAEGAMATINEMVIRMRELTIQAANDSNTLDDRGQIQREINEIIYEIDAVAHRTEFNTRVLLSGNYGKDMFASFSMVGFNDAVAFDAGIIPFADNQAEVLADMIRTAYFNLTPGQRNNLIGSGAGATAINVRNWANSILPAGFRWGLGPSFNAAASANVFGDGFTNNITGLNNFFENDFFIEGHRSRQDSITSIADAHMVEQMVRQAFLALPADDPVRSAGGAVFYSWIQGIFLDLGNFNGVIPASVINGTPAVVHNWMTAGANATPSPANPLAFFSSDNIMGMAWERFGGFPPIGNAPGGHQGLWIQKGANLAQGMFITIEAMTARRLGIQFINVTREHGFDIQFELDTIDNALSHVISERTHLGALQNRLEFAKENVSVASENLTQANSRIRDADMAQEMMHLTVSNLLQQAGFTMLAQANTNADRILQLLR